MGLERTGFFETRWQIEIDPYASAVLAKHWPNVQRFSDITTVSNPPTVDVICGGFPCQDVSVAGARAGLEGKRSTLWSELFRLVCEVRPRWLVAENVPGLLANDDGRFMGAILRDLASIGFDAEWGVLSAGAMGAAHLRRRVFILAYPHGVRRHRLAQNQEVGHSGLHQQNTQEWFDPSTDLHLPMVSIQSVPNSGIRRNDDGVSEGLDGLRCYGNAVAPPVAQRIGEMILAYEASR